MRLALVLAVLAASACAGPKFVRECRELTVGSETPREAYQRVVAEDDALAVELSTCRAENDRLMFMKGPRK